MKGKKKKVNGLSDSQKALYTSIVGVFLIIIVLIFGTVFSYAYWNTTISQKEQNYVESGCLSFKFNDKDVDDNVTNIELLNSYPISDSKGLSLEPYTFTITNTCTLKGSFNIYLHNLLSSNIDSGFIKVALKSNDVLLANFPILVIDLQSAEIDSETSLIINNVGTIKEDYLLHTFNLDPEQSATFELLLWIDESAPNSIMGSSYESAISVFANPID